MKMVKTRHNCFSHKLYVEPTNKREKFSLWLRGYRVWNEGIIAGFYMVKKEHKHQK